MIRNGHQKNGEQEYKCNWCKARFNRRKGTPLEGLRTPIYVIVMAMYMCGVGMIAAVTGKQEKTVERWIRRIAPHCEVLIKKKTKVWIWTGIDVVTRLFIAFHIGDRSLYFRQATYEFDARQGQREAKTYSYNCCWIDRPCLELGGSTSLHLFVFVSLLAC